MQWRESRIKTLYPDLNHSTNSGIYILNYDPSDAVSERRRKRKARTPSPPRMTPTFSRQSARTRERPPGLHSEWSTTGKPLPRVKVLEGIFSSTQKREIVRKLTDTMVSIEGKNLRLLTQTGDG